MAKHQKTTPNKHTGGNGNTMKKGGDWKGDGGVTGDGKKSNEPQTKPLVKDPKKKAKG